MNTIITATVAGLTASSTDDSQLRQGANQTPIPKVWAQHIVTVLATELKPITLVRMDSQGATTQFVVASHYGPCPEVPDGHNMAGIVPLVAGTQMKDDFGLPIAGAPAPNQKLLMTQVTPGDSYAMGVSSVSPDGVTSPAIPNSGDVTPGTAASNPAAYLTGPVTKQHPWLTDVVAGCGIQQTAYGKYDYTDPTGTLHTALGKGDSKVKKPLLEIKRATNTTALYSGQVTLAGSSPTEYLHSGLRCADDAGENHGLVVHTKWGTSIDKDDAVDVWLAASSTLPTDGEGDQTARALPCYDGDVYNTSALGEDGGDSGHALYVKLDGESTSQTADGKVRSQAIKVTHALPPTDDDIPATAEDGALVDATTDDSLWMRSSGALVRVSIPTGGLTSQVLGKIDATNYNVDWIDAENPNCVCLTLAQLIDLIGSVSIAATGGGSGGGGGVPPEGGLVYSASSTFTGDGSGGSIPGFVYGPSRAFDGNDGTEWGAVTGNSGEWVQVDFGLPITVSAARVVQQISQFAATYTVSSSANGSIWTVRATGSAPAAGAQVLSFSPVSARFWRWTATSPTTGGGHTVFTFNPS